MLHLIIVRIVLKALRVPAAEQRAEGAGSGGESPIILTERMPKIRGVIVIAEGAADISVRFSLAAAVSTVLGIDENSVEVFAMRRNE